MSWVNTFVILTIKNKHTNSVITDQNIWKWEKNISISIMNKCASQSLWHRFWYKCWLLKKKMKP